MERQLGPIESIRRDHLKRYEFAASKIPPKSSVLDAACGCGYGSWMLHQAKNRVVGVDASKDAIAYAKENYKGPAYINDWLESSPWEGSFKAVVSFETIEHLPNPDDVLEQFRLAANGVFIASVPNEQFYPFRESNFAGEQFPHLRHYTPEDFEALLERTGFEVTERFCQKDKNGDITPGSDGMFLIYVCK